MARFTLQAPALALDLHSDWPIRVAPFPVGSGASWKRFAGKELSTLHLTFLKRGPLGSICASSTIAPSKDGAVDARENRRLEDVVIVGSGIAGLATALALHRVGVKSIVLEQSDSLRTSGATIGLWTNAWRALDVLGIADSLRNKYTRVERVEFYAADGKLLSKLSLTREVELRPVDRKLLLKALEEPLPHDTICYNAKVVGIRKDHGGYTEVELQNGSTLLTKVLVGCDGTGSVVARWMGFKEPRYVGQIAIRGVAVYTEGHELKDAGRQILGRGVRVGLVPVDSNRVYWFVVFNSSSVEKITDRELVREEALSFVQGWPFVVTDAINKTPAETLSRRALSDRWMWPVVIPPLFKDGVTLAGDAMHPMTPNLGQGGCCALEEGVILGRALSKAVGSNSVLKKDEQANGELKKTDSFQERKEIEIALDSYTSERRHRMFPLAVRSYLIGSLLNLDSELVSSIRDKLLPRLLKLERFVDHTFYDCGAL